MEAAINMSERRPFRPGVFEPGPLNAITDVAGVSVGHVTRCAGEAVRTGVTVIRPHAGDVFQDKAPAGVFVANGFGKFIGLSQIEELGEIETPIALTNTLSAPEAAAGLIDHALGQAGNEAVVSVNPVVGEVNDSRLNDIRSRQVQPSHVVEALKAAHTGPVVQGAVGAGAGSESYGWKGGIGSASRVLEVLGRDVTLGALVLTNQSGVFTPLGRSLPDALQKPFPKRDAPGSIIVVIACDAPLCSRNLQRLARRAMLGVARTGSPMANGSGEYALAFSTDEAVRRTPARRTATSMIADWPNAAMTPLFQAAMEASEEAVLNAMICAVTTRSSLGSLERFPFEQL
ncbi:MAG: P1 family peptidase [Oceanicaulis sp.]